MLKIVKELESNDINEVQNAATSLRQMLSVEFKPPFDEFIQCGAVKIVS